MLDKGSSRSYLLIGMKTNVTSPVMGRPRGFDAEAVLDSALRVFWEKGYEGASLTDLTDAMGINRPSLYAAFGNKESLFRKVLERYAGGPAAYVTVALAESTARAVAERLLTGSVEMLGCSENPRGCLITQSALACGEEAKSVREALIKARWNTLEAIRERFERAREEGEFPPGTDTWQLARFISTVMQGMSIQASGGACMQALGGVVEMAMRAWPGKERIEEEV
jgi:AcrR family transcriptional regulator